MNKPENENMDADPNKDLGATSDPFPLIWRFLKRWFLEILLVAGVVACFPDFAREVGVMGLVVAICSSILIGARMIAQAVRDGRN